ncbi:MAG: hypothetical protein Q8O89_07640 [Nanoarchaeota archaeon]|nr:hypothetical protein [Nanoarchaeota archaeon]
MSADEETLIREEQKAIENMVKANSKLKGELKDELHDLESLRNEQLKGAQIFKRKILAVRELLAKLNSPLEKEKFTRRCEALSGLIRIEIKVIEQDLKIERHEETSIKRAFIVNSNDYHTFQTTLLDEKKRAFLAKNAVNQFDMDLRNKLIQALIAKLNERNEPREKIRAIVQKILAKEQTALKYLYEQATPIILHDVIVKDSEVAERCMRQIKLLSFRMNIRKKLEQSILNINKEQLQVLNRIKKELYANKGELPAPVRKKLISEFSILYAGTETLIMGGLLKKEKEALEKLNSEIFMDEEEQKKLMSMEEWETTACIHLAQLLNRQANKIAAIRRDALWRFFNAEAIVNELRKPPFGPAPPISKQEIEELFKKAKNSGVRL